jgi:radical SAM protein with 4Fe4S-binding SPASM domain
VTAKSFVRKVPSGRSLLWRAAPPKLARLDIELTERCNNACLHCSVARPAGDLEAKAREWPAERWKALLGEAAALGCLVVRFTGGEPLLRPDFEEIYRHARKLGLRVMLFTNATLLTPRLARLLRDVPPLETVEVSIYGMTRESCEAVTRVSASFEAARRGVGLLVEHRVPFTLKGAVLPPTRDEVDAFEAWATGLPGHVGTPAFAMVFDLHSRRDAGRSAVIAGLRTGAEDFVTFSRRRGDEAVAEWRDFCGRAGGARGDRLFICGTGAASASIDPYGRLQYCLGLRHPAALYDLGTGSLREAVTVFLPGLRASRATDPAYLERCARCFLRGLCQQCPVKSWAEHGTLDTPVEYFCGIAHAQAVAAGLLEPGEKAWTVVAGAERIKKGERP